MKEALLHFVWKHLLIKPERLETTEGENIEIIFQGNYNTNEGADFTEAKIRIGNTILVGNIEIHVYASDWNKHQHRKNKKYNNVILHVVFMNDQTIPHLPTLELNGKISSMLLKKYNQLLQNSIPVPCHNNWNEIETINLLNIKERILFERLENKKIKILNKLNELQQDWLKTKYNLLLQYFGGNINKFGFEQLAQRLDYKILIKHADNLTQIEALLFGTAGFLEDDFEDIYYVHLQKEYQYLKIKYNLVSLSKSIWNFLRMRPANFPTIKIALLANLIQASPQLFHLQHISATKQFLSQLVASSYWDTHYTFGKASKLQQKKLGESSINSLIINYSIPLFYTYQSTFEHKDVFQACIDYYELLPFEENHKVKYFYQAQGSKNATDSQFLIELYDHYCSQRKCLECKVAYQILKKETKQEILNV